MSGPSLLLAAVEPSGDALGAALFPELRKTMPQATFFGCGGALMAEQGFESLFPTEPLAVMGFTDVARALPEGFRRARQLAQEAAARRADAAILIDGWAFSRVTAKRLKALSPGTKVFKYAAPQVWASRPRRVDFVRAHFDGVLALLPFEPPWFEGAGVRAAFVGNPTFEKAARARGDGAAFRARRGLCAATLLCVLPGSRRSEVARLLDVFESVVSRLAVETDDLHILAPLAPSVEDQARAAMTRWSAPVHFIAQAEKYDAFAAADAALAASGTVSTELAINRTPMVVAYRVDPFTAYWARRVKTTRYVSILNILAGDFVIPEFIQEDCAADGLADALGELFRTGGGDQKAAFEKLLPRILVDDPPPAARAAAQIAGWLEKA